MRSSQEALLTSAIDGLYACATSDAGWPDALQSIGRAFGSPRVGLLQTTAAVDRMIDMKGLNFDAEAQSLYNEYYWRLDPTLDASRRARTGDWADCSPLFDPRTTPHREYVHDYALPHGLRWVAGGKVHGDADSCTILGLQRPADARPFDSDCAELFGRLRPHLERVCLISRELRATRALAARSGAAVDGLQQCAMVVSRAGALLFANRAGESGLARGSPFACRSARVVATRAASTAVLEHAIEAATATRHRRASAWTERSPRGCDWIVRVVPMDEESACALVYWSPAHPSFASTELLSQAFSLTTAEADIARQLAEGLTVKEVAYARGVSELTVRAQVRAIITKTGARRLSGLQSLVRSVPALKADAD